MMRRMARARDEPIDLETLEPLPARDPPAAPSEAKTTHPNTRHQPWWLIMSAAVLFGALLGSVATAAFDQHQSASPRAGVKRHPTATGMTAGSSTTLVGTWWAHAMHLTISKDGVATLDWRRNPQCGVEPPPCDRFVHDHIYDGGHATIIFRPSGRRSVGGMVVASTDTRDLQLRPMQAWLDVKQGLLFIVPFPGAEYPFCREHAFDVCGA
jgi:hypothetical protein